MMARCREVGLGRVSVMKARNPGWMLVPSFVDNAKTRVGFKHIQDHVVLAMDSTSSL
jgi:hypothetical protein